MTPVGRNDEYSALQRARQERAGALIVGPAGIGKTHLARAFIADLEDMGWPVERFHASTATLAVPLGALARIVGGLGDGTVDLAHLTASVSDTLSGDEPGRAPAILFDDAHLLDDASLMVVQQLANSGRASVWLTVRSGETIPDAVVALWRAGTIDRVDVGPLDRESADVLAETLLEGPSSGELLDALWAHTTGVPLYLRETIHDAVAEEVAREADGGWTLAGELRAGRRVQDLLLHRLDRLGPTARNVIELVAIAEPTPVTLLTSAEQEEVHGLERRGALQWEDPTSRAFLQSGHPLLGEVARSAISADRSAELTTLLADRLVAQEPRPHGTALRLAVATAEKPHELPAGLLVVAAREALAAFEPAEAERLARRALAADPSSEAHHVLGDVLLLAGDIDAADRHLTTAADLATDDKSIVRIAHARANLHAYLRSDPRTAIGILQAAAPRLQSLQAQLELRSETAVTAALLGRFPEVLETGEEILAVEGIPDETRSITLGNICYAQAMLIRLDGFEQNWQQAIDLLQEERLGDKPAEHDLLWAIRTSVAMERGEFVDGLTALDTHLDECRDQHRYRGIAELIGSHMLVSKGDVAARDAVDRSLEQLDLMDPFSTTTLARAAAALAASLDGDAAATAAFLDGLEPDAVADDPRAVAWLGRALAGQAALAGDLEEAAQIAAEAGRRAVKGSQLGWGSLALHDAARLGRPELVAEELAEILADTGADYMELLQFQAMAAAGRDLGRLRDAAVRFGRMSAWLHSGETWLDLARLTDDPDQRRDATVSAQLICAQTTLRHWPLWSLVEPVLSPRELDVVLLAGSGHTSKEIAERLFVSGRTVDNHLGRVYRRLDLPGRAELGDAFAHALFAGSALPED